MKSPLYVVCHRRRCEFVARCHLSLNNTTPLVTLQCHIPSDHMAAWPPHRPCVSGILQFTLIQEHSSDSVFAQLVEKVIILAALSFISRVQLGLCEWEHSEKHTSSCSHCGHVFFGIRWDFEGIYREIVGSYPARIFSLGRGLFCFLALNWSSSN